MKISWDKYNRAYVELRDDYSKNDYKSSAWIKENVSSLPHIPANGWMEYYNEYMNSCSKSSSYFIISSLEICKN